MQALILPQILHTYLSFGANRSARRDLTDETIESVISIVCFLAIGAFPRVSGVEPLRKAGGEAGDGQAMDKQFMQQETRERAYAKAYLCL